MCLIEWHHVYGVWRNVFNRMTSFTYSHHIVLKSYDVMSKLCDVRCLSRDVRCPNVTNDVICLIVCYVFESCDVTSYFHCSHISMCIFNTDLEDILLMLNKSDNMISIYQTWLAECFLWLLQVRQSYWWRARLWMLSVVITGTEVIPLACQAWNAFSGYYDYGSHTGGLPAFNAFCGYYSLGRHTDGLPVVECFHWLLQVQQSYWWVAILWKISVVITATAVILVACQALNAVCGYYSHGSNTVGLPGFQCFCG